MAKLTITIDTDNAAFDPHPRFEIIATLLDLVARIEHGIMRLDTTGSCTLYDSNGNACGAVAYTQDATNTDHVIRTYDELTHDEQTRAREIALNDLLRAVCEGSIRFNDEQNGDDLQSRIDVAWQRAENMRTPWFIHEYIMDTCADDLRALADASAQDAIYVLNDENVIRLPNAQIKDDQTS